MRQAGHRLCLASACPAGGTERARERVLTQRAVAAAVLAGADLPAGEPAARRLTLLDRLSGVAAKLLPPGAGAAPPLCALLPRLQAALSATEKLQLALHCPPAAGSVSGLGMGMGSAGFARHIAGEQSERRAGCGLCGLGHAGLGVWIVPWGFRGMDWAMVL